MKTKKDNVKNPSHYARFAIEPYHFIYKNNLLFWQGNVIKYVMRYDDKNGIEDLRKAIQCIEMVIEEMENEK